MSTAPLTPAGLASLANLARLELADDERAALGGHLERILGWVAELERIDTEGVSPSQHETPLPLGALREDATGPSLDRDQALENAPARDPLGFLVPRVVSE